MFKATVSQIDIEEAIMRAVRHLDDSEGVSVSDIELYMLPILNNTPALETIQSVTDSAVEKGLLIKLPSGNYKIKEVITEECVEVFQEPSGERSEISRNSSRANEDPKDSPLNKECS